MRNLSQPINSYGTSCDMAFHFFDLRMKSLMRGSLLVVASLVAGLLLSHFPHNHPSAWIILPTMAACWGTWETIRCMKRRWSWYHGGVILLVYADLMVLAILFFSLLYPYARWMSSAK